MPKPPCNNCDKKARREAIKTIENRLQRHTKAYAYKIDLIAWVKKMQADMTFI